MRDGMERDRSKLKAQRAPRFEALEPRWHLHGGGEIEPQHEEGPGHTIFDHVHYLLAIFINGERQIIPPDIGVGPNGVIAFSHTHALGVEGTDDDPFGGLVHVHPVNNELPSHLQTVGDFFEIWRTNAGLAGNNPDAIFNDNQILSFVANDEFAVRMYIRHDEDDDETFLLHDGFEDYVPHDLDTVLIAYEPAGVVQLGGKGNTIVTYIDGDGTNAAVGLNIGNATVNFAGEDVQISPGKKGPVVTGQNLRITSINMSDTTVKSKLTVKAKGGDGAIEIGNVNSTGPLGAIAAKLADFTGIIDLDGPLKKFDARNLDNVQINVGPSANAKDTLTLNFINGTDLGVNSVIPIKGVKALNWINQDAEVEELQAPWLGSFAVKEQSGVNLDLTGQNAPGGTVLKSAKIGTIVGGAWNAVGNVSTIAATDISAAWSAVVTGAIKGIKAANNAGGDIQAAALQSFAVKNNLTDTDILLTLAFDPADTKAKMVAMKSFKVGGTVQDFSLRSNTHLGALQAGRFMNTTVFAGVMDDVADGTLPGAGDFENQSQIKGVKVKGLKDQPVAMQNAQFAASVIGSVAAAFATDPQSGFAATAFVAFSYTDEAGKQTLDKLVLATPDELQVDPSLIVRIV